MITELIPYAILIAIASPFVFDFYHTVNTIIDLIDHIIYNILDHDNN